MKQENIYQAMFEYASFGMLLIDDNDKIFKANLFAANLFGYGVDQLIGQSIYILGTNDFKKELRKCLDKSKRKLEGFSTNFELNSLAKKKNGTTFSVIINGTEIISEKKQLFLLHLKKATANPPIRDKEYSSGGRENNNYYKEKGQLRTSAEKLALSEAKAKILFDYSACIIWEEDFSPVKKYIDWLKAKGITNYRQYFTDKPSEIERLASLITITQVNQESLKFYGVDSKEALITTLPEWFVEESWGVFTEEIIALAEGAATFDGEIKVMTPKGEIKHLFLRLSVPPQYMDTLESVLISFIDVTDLKHQTILLRESENRFRDIIENLPTAAIIVDEKEQVFLNKAAEVVMGYNRRELKTVTQLFQTIHKERYAIFMEGYLDYKDINFFEKTIFPFYKKSGEECWVEFQGYEFSDGEAWLFKDITIQRAAQKQLEENSLKLQNYATELEASVKERTADLRESELKLKKALEYEKELGNLKSRFVSMASHEFRTPLSSILASVETLELYIKAGKFEKADRNINRVRNSVINLNRILNDFLSLEKLETGQQDAQFTSIPLDAFLTELSEEFTPILHPNQQLLFKIGAIETIYSDPFLLKNILINLISNAIKYSPNGKDVLLEITKSKENLVFKVVDQGMGIPEAEKVHMFSRFFRASNVETINGTGLGLTIVKRYLDLLGGQINFKSTYGEGSVFYFNLPSKIKE